MDLEKYPSIKELGSRSLFKLTQVDFWVDSCTGLPLEDVTCVDVEGAEDICDTTYNGSDRISWWLECCKRDHHYNFTTRDLTWVPPPDMKNLGSVYGSHSNTRDGSSGHVNPMRIHNEHLSGSELTASAGNTGVLMEDYFSRISKYWSQKHLLFSKYDDGIKLDEEGWFSATPECIAEHHAFRSGKGVIVDGFTGCGGNAIRFAAKGSHVIAIDIDKNRIECAQHNAAIYGVEEHINFITGDFFILAKKLEADTVFLSPPWGGPEYVEAHKFDLKTMLKPRDGQFLFNVAKKIAPRVVMYLPRNVDIGQLGELALSASPPWTLEVEKNFLNNRLKAITAYFTDPSLVKTD